MEICRRERELLRIQGVFCKNLFVRDKKKQFFLISALEDSEVDLKSLRKDLGANRCLTFSTEEELSEKLKVSPGGVTPLAALNCEKDPDVKVVLDKGILDAELANFHPLDPEATVTLATADLLLFLASCGLEVIVHEFERKSPSPSPSPSPSGPASDPASDSSSTTLVEDGLGSFESLSAALPRD